VPASSPCARVDDTVIHSRQDAGGGSVEVTMIERLEALLASGKDGALLRFGLGAEYLRTGDAARAATHLREALARDPCYSAAWKLLGRALEAVDPAAAMDAYERGIAAAQARGDKQAARQMQVFLKRLSRRPGTAP
jgi:predicted Zn-dependent protease